MLRRETRKQRGDPVVRRLHLLRHAKSSWDDPALPDHDRPLAPRGRRAAKRLARWLAEHEIRPQLVLCSTAVRATQTLDRLAPGLGGATVRFEDGLYLASASDLLERVRMLPDDVVDAVLVGHNPGLGELCLLLARPGTLRDRVAANLPTGAFATLELGAARWQAVEAGCADLRTLVLPRELE